MTLGRGEYLCFQGETGFTAFHVTVIDQIYLHSFIKSNLEFAAEQQKLSRIKKLAQTTTILQYSVEIRKINATYYYPIINVNKVHVKLFLRTCH